MQPKQFTLNKFDLPKRSIAQICHAQITMFKYTIRKNVFRKVGIGQCTMLKRTIVVLAHGQFGFVGKNLIRGIWLLHVFFIKF
jgi:hypothetical protein